MSRVLVVSGDGVAERMAGPAIRCLELARVLAGAGHDVTLAAPQSSAATAEEPFAIVACDRRALRGLADAHDAILVQGWVLERAPALAAAERPLVVDLYDPFALELLMLLEDEGAPAREKAGFSGTTTISRKDFGLRFNKLLETGGAMVGDDVRISLEIEAGSK